MGEEIKKYKQVVTEQPWGCKYSVGNGEAKELLCMTHGHEQWWEGCLRDWGVLVGGGRRGKIQTTVIA